jgi:hypothetical protein
VPADRVVVKLTASGQTCACSRASVCGSRQAYDGSRDSGEMRTTAEVVADDE